MRIGAIILAIGSAAPIGFGYWGQMTESGRRQFDEMDGMYPFFAMWGGIALAGIAEVLRLQAGNQSPQVNDLAGQRRGTATNSRMRSREYRRRASRDRAGLGTTNADDQDDPNRSEGPLA